MKKSTLCKLYGQTFVLEEADDISVAHSVEPCVNLSGIFDVSMGFQWYGGVRPSWTLPA